MMWSVVEQSFGQRVAARREELGLSVRRIAMQSEVSETAWRNIERGRELRAGVTVASPNPPQRVTVHKIAKALGWDVRDAMLWAGHEYTGAVDDVPQEQVADPRGEIAEILPQLSESRARALLHVARAMLDAMADVPAATFESDRRLVREVPAFHESSHEEREATRPANELPPQNGPQPT
jgi:transcriptional regulator with XRE-family HTH domain